MPRRISIKKPEKEINKPIVLNTFTCEKCGNKNPYNTGLYCNHCDTENTFKCPNCGIDQSIAYLITQKGICNNCDKKIYNETINETSTEIEIYQHKKTVLKTKTVMYLYDLVLGTIAQKDFSNRPELLMELLEVHSELKEVLNK